MDDLLDIKRETLSRALRGNVEGEIRFDAVSRMLYSTDASIYQIEPIGVVIPRSVADLRAVVQVAQETRTPLVPRGGGTSLSGQSIGPGIIVDCSKYLNRVLDIDLAGRVARVQPGVVLDAFNRALALDGMQFGPDVATASRANLGGMIGNNSAGARSIVYGKTGDHVRGLKVILADGNMAEFGPKSPEEWHRLAEQPTRLGALYRQVRDCVREHEREISRRFPRILRRVSGYDLLSLADALANGSAPAKAASLTRLIVGGEGTLGLVAEAEVGLVPRPKVRGLLVPQFESLAMALDAVGACLETKPSAVELMDHHLLELAQGNLSLRNTMAAIKGKPKALLMVEMSGDDGAEVADRLTKLQARLREISGLTASVVALDPGLRDPLWNLRSAAMPLLYSLPGDRKPVTFVEDTAVPPERLPEFIQRFREVLSRHGTEGAFYGHASVGCLHIRPVLNLKDPADVARMRQIMEEISSVVLEFGGALSGEHGDGLARSEWNRKMYGSEVYEAFKTIKRVFDPDNLFNPGKVVDGPSMTENLRLVPGTPTIDPPTIFSYARQEGFLRSIELCNGSGVCRRLQGGTMCPSFRATLDENDTTRGRANALRHALAGNAPPSHWDSGSFAPGSPTSFPHGGPASFTAANHRLDEGRRDRLRAPWLAGVFDLCLMCKACKAECPSNVDMAKLKAEFLQAFYDGRGRPLGHHLAAQIYRFNRWASPVAFLVNYLQNLKPSRWLLEKFAGIDQRRSLPTLHQNHFRRWFRRHQKKRGSSPGGSSGSAGRVILLDDCLTTYTEPNIGRSAVKLLDRLGHPIELAGLTCCGRALISKGFLREARDLVRQQAAELSARLEPGVPILGLEPSCLLTLADEWPELVPGSATERIAQAARLTEDWLANRMDGGRGALSFMPMPATCIIHGHCHQKALVGLNGTAAALKLIPELDVQALDTGCCGMAGSFGFEKEHYDLSLKIADLSVLPALAANPNAVVAVPGTSCRHQVRDLTQRRPRHPLEILADQLSS